MKKDNWEGRASGMVCKTCIFFVPKLSNVIREAESPDMGRCRRHAPTMGGFPQNAGQGP